MQPLTHNPEHPPKRNKPKPWVLTYVLVPLTPSITQTRTGEVTECLPKPITIKDRYPTEKSAEQALDVAQSSAGMWRKEIWAVVKWKIERVTK